MRNCWVIIAVGSLLLSGCGGGGSSNSVSQSSVNFYNAIPDSTALDMNVQSASLSPTTEAKQLAYLGSTAAPVNLNADTYDVSLTEHGATMELNSITSTLSASQSYAIVALGLENFGTEFDKRATYTLVNTDISTTNGSKSRLIVVNALNRATGFSVTPIDFQDGDIPQFAVTNLAFGSSSTEIIDSGVRAFQARQPGTSYTFVSDSTATPPTFLAGKTYLVLVTGTEGASGAAAPQIKYILLN